MSAVRSGIHVFIYDLKQYYVVNVFVSNETFTLQCSKIREHVEKVKKMLDYCEVWRIGTFKHTLRFWL